MMKLRVTLWWKLLFVISLTLSLLLGRVYVTDAQTPEPSQLVQQGVTEYQDSRYKQAIAKWNQALSSYRETGDLVSKAIVLENLARAYQTIGQTDNALALWQKVADVQLQLGNTQELGRSLTEQAQAYSRLGQHRQAISILCGTSEETGTLSPGEKDATQITEEPECLPGSAISIAQQQEDRLGTVAALGSLGEAYRLRGNYEKALSYLEPSLAMAQTIQVPQLEVSLLNSLGNTNSSLAQVNYRRAEFAEKRGEVNGTSNFIEAGKQRDNIALNYFKSSLDLTTAQTNTIAQVKAIISSLPIYYRLENYAAAAKQRQKALNLLPSLPKRAETVYATIDLAKLIQPAKLTPKDCLQPEAQPQARELLQQAVTLAREIGDLRAESFALGELGHIYECSADYQQALKLTQEARLAAEQNLQAKDSLYLWEWQTGRILIKQGNQPAGIAAYEKAIATLEHRFSNRKLSSACFGSK